MALTIEKEWITKAGLKAIAAIVRTSHRVGYVGVPKAHPLYGKEYQWHLDKELWDKLENNKEPYKGSPIDILIASGDRNENTGPQLSYYFNVHGGITYAGGGDNYPTDGDEWWFGFDCNHLGDAQIKSDYPSDGVVRSLEYVIDECESLAEQIDHFQKAGDK